ncbi:MAG: Ig-like domain-containing protein [Odoribacteraceae bacterium]|nr:Ig-like domain-containing protein [Odoribacteraceae bacterium]
MKRKSTLLVLSLALLAGCEEKASDLAVKAITVSPNSLTLKPGQSRTLTATIFPDNAADKTVSWSSSAPEIASVTAAGEINAITLGNATITATAGAGGEHATASVSVTANDPVAVGVKGAPATAVEGVWEKYTIVSVNGQVYVPAGKTLTIEEGVEVIISADAQDNSNTRVEFIVEGSLFCLGTEEAPVTFTIPAGERDRKTSGRYWGGIIGGAACPAILLDHVLVEYTGAITTAASPSVTRGLFKAGGGDGMVAFNTNNPAGKYVITNSTFRYTGEDAIYVQGGECLFTRNLFYAVGDEGGEAINVKAGCKVDAAFNVMYSPNTNAFKLSNSGFGGARFLAQINAYNNTIINSGWRRDPGKPKGGSVWAESGHVNVFNNLIVNCMFGAKAPNFGAGGEDGVVAESVIDYNFYASGTAGSNIPQHVQNGTVTAHDGFKPGRTDDVVYGARDERGAFAGDNDPRFVAFPFATNPVLDIHLDESWNLHLQAGSPALDASKTRTGFTPYFSANGITVNGTTYKSPLPAGHFGAFGQN